MKCDANLLVGKNPPIHPIDFSIASSEKLVKLVICRTFYGYMYLMQNAAEERLPVRSKTVS